ncbi:MAG: acyl carrier protein [Myxococcota bacterium]
MNQFDEAMVNALSRALDEQLEGLPEPQTSLIEDLGFDSLKITMLALELEVELGVPVLLNDWLSSVNSPAELTIQSLADFLAGAPGAMAS